MAKDDTTQTNDASAEDNQELNRLEGLSLGSNPGSSSAPPIQDDFSSEDQSADYDYSPTLSQPPAEAEASNETTEDSPIETGGNQIESVNDPETAAQSSGELDSTTLENVKKAALSDLEPIIDELELPAEEKFGLIIKILTQTNHKDLLQKAHQAAKNIADDKKRANALIEIINQIDSPD